MMSEGKTIGQLMEEMRAKAGAQNYHGHGYAYLSGCMFNDPVGMAIYAELHYMMSSLMLGEWFE